MCVSARKAATSADVVLEPISRHRMRRRSVQLPAVARGNGVCPDDEIRVRIRNSGVLPENGRPFGFYEHCLFHTTVQQTEWDETAGRWTVTTDRGDAMRARFVILANGILTTPKLARIEGMQTFRGETFHTSRWNYDVDLKGKTVGIIGTGATAVQAIPELAKVVRNSSSFNERRRSIDIRDQRATTDEERRDLGRGTRLGPRAGAGDSRRYRQGRTAIQANDDYLAGRVAGFQGAQTTRADAQRGRLSRNSSTRTFASWSRSARAWMRSSKIP